jgi:hypothetical protein
MTLTDIFTGINATLNSMGPLVQSHLSYTRLYNLPLTCYEAGQGLLGSNSITNGLQIGAQTDDRMRLAYIKYY